MSYRYRVRLNSKPKAPVIYIYIYIYIYKKVQKYIRGSWERRSVASKLENVQIFIATDSTKHFTQFFGLRLPIPLLFSRGVSVPVIPHHTISPVDGC